MAGKKIPSVEDALKIFKDVMLRALLSDYLYVNRTMLSKNPKDHSILIIPDQELWVKIIEDPDMKDHINELDINNPDQYKMLPLFEYGNNLNSNDWIEIDPEILFKGKVFRISMKGFEYEVPINRGLLPLKLRKAEYNNISYKVFSKPSLMLVLKKRFDFPLEGCGFTILRMFKVI